MSFEALLHIDSPSSAKIALRYQAPVAAAHAVFLLCHGLAEHSLRYSALAGFLAGRGFHVYAHDHRGHGFTRAEDAPQGRFARRHGEAAVLADVAAVREAIGGNHPGMPVILFGHSMGGVIAALAAEQQPNAWAGLSIWNSDLAPGLAGQMGLLLLKSERFFKGSDVPSRLGRMMVLDAWAKAIGGATTPFDWLSHDPEEVARYLADPLCGFDCSVSLWIDLVGMSLHAGRNLHALPTTMPVNLVGGGEDPATQNGRAMERLARRLRRHGIKNVDLTIYPQMRHETLNEVGREQAMKALADWADRVVEHR